MFYFNFQIKITFSEYYTTTFEKNKIFKILNENIFIIG